MLHNKIKTNTSETQRKGGIGVIKRQKQERQEIFTFIFPSPLV
jgi:hypothetical protein